MKRAVPLLAVLAFAFGCLKPKEPIVVKPDPPTPEAVAKELVRQSDEEWALSKQLWSKFPGFSTELGLSRTGLPLEEILPADYAGDMSDQFVQLGGVVIDDTNVALRLTDIGSGRYIWFVTIYLLGDDGWRLAYRLKEAASLVDHPIGKVGLKGLDLELSCDGRDTHWSTVMPLPGDADYVASG